MAAKKKNSKQRKAAHQRALRKKAEQRKPQTEPRQRVNRSARRLLDAEGMQNLKAENPEGVSALERLFRDVRVKFDMRQLNGVTEDDLKDAHHCLTRSMMDYANRSASFAIFTRLIEEEAFRKFAGIFVKAIELTESEAVQSAIVESSVAVKPHSSPNTHTFSPRMTYDHAGATDEMYEDKAAMVHGQIVTYIWEQAFSDKPAFRREISSLSTGREIHNPSDELIELDWEDSTGLKYLGDLFTQVKIPFAQESVGETPDAILQEAANCLLRAITDYSERVKKPNDFLALVKEEGLQNHYGVFPKSLEYTNNPKVMEQILESIVAMQAPGAKSSRWLVLNPAEYYNALGLKQKDREADKASLIELRTMNYQM